MLKKLTLTAAALCTAVVITSATTVAAPATGLSPLKALTADQQIIEKTHGWHRKCRKGLNQWHRHVKGVGRVQCTTAKNCYTNVFGFRVCNWF